MKTILNIFTCLALSGLASCQEARTVKVNVTEEDGTPIERVNTIITFLGYSGKDTHRANGETDGKGIYQATGHPPLRMSMRLEKEGYYTTRSGRLSRHKDHDLTFVLRKVKNPIPLYAKRFRGVVPRINEECGFDFKMSDWVQPLGKGKEADLYFKVEIVRDGKGKTAGNLEITFPHKEGGATVVNTQNGYLPQSSLVMPHEAFSNGYQGKIERLESGYENKNKPIHTSYFFRTRGENINTKKQEFNFTKLKNGIDFMMSGGVFMDEKSRPKHPNEVGIVTFTYYFNPKPNDQNLEFDPARNLFKNLDVTEMVHEP